MRNYKIRFVQGDSATKNGSTNFMGARGSKSGIQIEEIVLEENIES